MKNEKSIRRFRKKPSGSSEVRPLLGGTGTRFLARSRPLALTFQFSEAPGAPRARIFARSGPPALDFGSPGRSRARFWRPKRLDLRGGSTLAHGRCVHCPRLTKHCVGARILSFELLRDTTKTMRNRSASVLDSARCTKCARGWLRSRPGASWDPPGEAFGRSPNALGPPRTPKDRSRGLFWASRTRPKRVPARSRNGFERQKPPKINFASIFRRFGLRFRRYSKDFSSNFFELPATKAQNRNLKKESRDPHFASWFWRGAVASYCLHVFRNDFRTLHAQPYLGACPQAHLV